MEVLNEDDHVFARFGGDALRAVLQGGARVDVIANRHLDIKHRQVGTLGEFGSKLIIEAFLLENERADVFVVHRGDQRLHRLEPSQSHLLCGRWFLHTFGASLSGRQRANRFWFILLSRRRIILFQLIYAF